MIERNRSNSIHHELSLSYWLKQFEDELPVLELPTYRLRPATKSFKQSSVERSIDYLQTQKLKSLLNRHDFTLLTGVISLVNVLFYRYTNQEDIVIGSLLSPVEHDKTDSLNHAVALRSRFSGTDNFIQLLETVKKLTLECAPHSTYSLKELIKELNLPEDKSRNPLFDVMVMLEDTDTGKMEEHADINISGLDLIFAFRETEGGLNVDIQYDSDLFEEQAIIRMGNHLLGLLSAMLEQPEQSINQLDYLSVDEKNQLLHDFNDTSVSYPDTKTIIDLFEEQVLKTPDNIALVFEQELITYQQLNERANQLAHYLRSKGIKSETLVPIFIERSYEMIVGILGILKIGAAFVPVDPEYPADRVSFMLTEINAKLIISSKNSISKLPDFEKITTVQLDEDWSEINEHPKNNLEIEITPANLAYIIFTSGSTGLPKGVMIEQGSVVNLLKSIDRMVGFTSESGFLSVTTYSFDICYLEFFMPLVNGGRLILVSREVAIDGFGLANAIKSYQPTHMQGTPATWHILLDAGWQNREGIRMLIGGEAVKEEIKDALTGLGDVYNLYGPTETTIWSVGKKLTANEKVLIGKPINNTTVYILGEDQQLLPVGVSGEIHIGGPGLSRGYLNRADLTELKFINNPLEGMQGTRIYKTGDIGRWLPDGNIECLGRMDGQVKIRGYRIELGEIENVLQLHPSIDGAVVLVVDGVKSDKRLVAYVRCQKEIDKNELSGFLKTKLPVYMIPTHFVTLKEFPLTANGKIDKKKFPKLEDTVLADEEISEYSSEEERIVGEIWCELLGLKNIRKTDDFFEIGGHSLIAIQFIVRLEEKTKIALAMSALFEYPTIEKIAMLLKQEDKSQKWKSLVEIKSSGNKPPLYLVHGLNGGVMIFSHLSENLDKDQPVNGLQALGFDGNDEPLESIEEMASFYISEILEQNPDGPYKIAGFSSGGLIAFEMAKQLKNLGKTVDKLVVFDFNLINSKKRKSLIFRLIDTTIESPFILLFNLKSLTVRPIKTIKHYIYRWNLRYRSFREILGYEEIKKLNNVELNLEKLTVKNVSAMYNYNVKPYDGNMDLFLSVDKVYYESEAKQLGWKPYVLKGIKIHKVYGDHDDMILPPNVKHFAATLQKILDDDN
jgi:amino acid adenylation domain-containing protein